LVVLVALGRPAGLWMLALVFVNGLLVVFSIDWLLPDYEVGSKAFVKRVLTLVGLVVFP
jgi:hypothetical protein